MRERWSPSTQTRPHPLSGVFRRILGRLRRRPLHRPSPGEGDASTVSYAKGTDWPRDQASQGDGDRTDPGRRWTERLASRIARPFRRVADPKGYRLSGPRHQQLDDAVLIRLQTGRTPKVQLDLILESLELLDDADARSILARLTDQGGGRASPSPATGPPDLAPGYGLAVIRFSQRLAWVAAREALGMSPPQRRALGLVRFRKLSAQVAADRLRLPREVVEYWVREDDLASGVG